MVDNRAHNVDNLAILKYLSKYESVLINCFAQKLGFFIGLHASKIAK